MPNVPKMNGLTLYGIQIESISFYVNRYNGSKDLTDILQYNITSDTIENISSLSVPSEGGLALKGKDSKYIYYFGGFDMKTSIHRFNSETKATVKLGTVLPSTVYYAAGLTTSQSAFIIDGRTLKIMEFDLASGSVNIIGNLPFENGTVISTASITDNSSDRVWLFPVSWDKLNNPVKIFNSKTRHTANPHQNVSVPSLSVNPATVSTGRYGYIIGGIGRKSEPDGTKHPSHGILR
jgi:hypothetical protein